MRNKPWIWSELKLRLASASSESTCGINVSADYGLRSRGSPVTFVGWLAVPPSAIRLSRQLVAGVREFSETIG